MLTFTKAVVAALATLSAVHGLPQAATPPSSSSPPEDVALLARDLRAAPTVVKRFQRLLTQGGALITGEALKKATTFVFHDATPSPKAKGGATKSANVDTFPILTGLGLTTTMAFIEPCGINAPHVHPRADEWVTLVEGSNLHFGYVLENGLVAAGQKSEIAGKLNKYEGTIFPMGSIHYQFNNNCKKAVTVSSLNSEDPGTSLVAQGFFALNAGVVNATLGFPKSIDGSNIEQFRSMIPANLVQDVDNCLAKCHN
ncbi:hypothetical protein IAQ61_006383 [Plenodomus lingam]|nr:hypothetical protein IAQ61_006383 [Plenodomus lingam]